MPFFGWLNFLFFETLSPVIFDLMLICLFITPLGSYIRPKKTL
jgi:hypothetical protein